MFHKKFKSYAFSCFAVCVLFTTQSSLVFSNEPIKIRFSHVAPEGSPKGLMARKFQQLVKERIGDDRVVVEVYPDSQLFNDSNIGQELLDGNIEMAVPSMSKIKKYSPRFQVMDLPFIFVTPEAASNFLRDGYGQRLMNLLNRHGLLGLGFFDHGMKQITSTKPIIAPEDMKGLTFRIVNSDVIESQYLQVGAKTTKQPYSKVYQLLKEKVFDGQENPWSNIFFKKFHEHQPYMLESNHGYLGYMMMTSEKFWSSLPNDLRKELTVLVNEALDYGNRVAKQEESAAREKLIASGLTDIHVMSLSEREKWVNAMKPIWKKYEDTIGSQLIQAAASSR